MAKPRKMRNVVYYTCSECAFHYAAKGGSSKRKYRIKDEGRCVSDSADYCPLGLPFASWTPHEDLPESIEAEIEQGEQEDVLGLGQEMVEHYKSVWERYKIPHNQFTEEEFDE